MKGLRIHRMTLLELLVSMSIFTVVMLILASMVYSVSQVTRKQQKQTDMYRDQRILMSVITQDLQSLVVSGDTGEEITCAFFTNGTFEPGDGYQYSGFFITNSGLGVTPGTDTSFLAEVFYCRPTTGFTTDTPLYRCMVPASSSAWNFIGNPAWLNRYGDAGVSPAIVATGVSEFKLEAVDAAENKQNGASTQAPVVVTVTAKFQDLGDTTGQDADQAHATRVFTKRVFTKRGDY